MDSNFFIMYGKYKDDTVFNGEVELKDKTYAGNLLLYIAQYSADLFYKYSGIPYDKIKEAYKTSSLQNMMKTFNIKKELRPVVNSYIYFSEFKHIIKGKIPKTYKTLNKKGFGYLFKYNLFRAAKKTSEKAKEYEISAFFGFAFETSLKYAFKLLDIKPSNISINSKGLKRMKELRGKINTLSDLYAVYLMLEKEQTHIPFPSNRLLRKAYPDLKVRRR